MLEQQLNLKFKGDRKYIHGTDIFDDTLTWLSTQKKDIRDIDYIFHRLAFRQLKLMQHGLPEGSEPVAVCNYTYVGLRECINLIETGQDVIEHYPYSENEIVNRTEIDPLTRSGILYGETRYSDIEVWVAMTKAIHCQVFSNLDGRWLFVRGRFPRYVRHSAAHDRTVRIASTFRNKLTRNEVFLDGVKVGDIYFSIV